MTEHKITFAAYFSSLCTFLLGWAVDNPTQFIGAACAIATAAVNWWFKYRQLRIIEKRVNQPFPNIDLDE